MQSQKSHEWIRPQGEKGAKTGAGKNTSIYGIDRGDGQQKKMTWFKKKVTALSWNLINEEGWWGEKKPLVTAAKPVGS